MQLQILHPSSDTRLLVNIEHFICLHKIELCKSGVKRVCCIRLLFIFREFSNPKDATRASDLKLNDMARHVILIYWYLRLF